MTESIRKHYHQSRTWDLNFFLYINIILYISLSLASLFSVYVMICSSRGEIKRSNVYNVNTHGHKMMKSDGTLLHIFMLLMMMMMMIMIRALNHIHKQWLKEVIQIFLCVCSKIIFIYSWIFFLKNRKV